MKTDIRTIEPSTSGHVRPGFGYLKVPGIQAADDGPDMVIGSRAAGGAYDRKGSRVQNRTMSSILDDCCQ